MKRNQNDNHTPPQTQEDLCLIEAAQTYAYQDWREDSLCGIAYYAFKAGAEWQREYERRKKEQEKEECP